MKRILFFLFVIISSLGDSNKDKNVNNEYIEEMSSEPLILKLFKSGYNLCLCHVLQMMIHWVVVIHLISHINHMNHTNHIDLIILLDNVISIVTIPF